VARNDVKVPEKRRVFEQKGGFLPGLLIPILGIAASLIGELVD